MRAPVSSSSRTRRLDWSGSLARPQNPLPPAGLLSGRPPPPPPIRSRPAWPISFSITHTHSQRRHLVVRDSNPRRPHRLASSSPAEPACDHRARRHVILFKSRTNESVGRRRRGRLAAAAPTAATRRRQPRRIHLAAGRARNSCWATHCCSRPRQPIQSVHGAGRSGIGS
jgi:hypothetical protein